MKQIVLIGLLLVLLVACSPELGGSDLTASSDNVVGEVPNNPIHDPPPTEPTGEEIEGVA